MLTSERTNGWSALTISRIRRLDGRQVVVGERRPARQLEVVVEAVLDRRPDRELGPGEQLGDGLGHDVGRGVAQHVATGVGVVGDDRHAGRHRPAAARDRPRDANRLIGDRDGDGRFGQALADRPGDVRGGGPGRVLPVGTVWQRDRDRGVHRREVYEPTASANSLVPVTPLAAPNRPRSRRVSSRRRRVGDRR